MHLDLILWYKIDVSVFSEQEQNILYVEIDLCISVECGRSLLKLPVSS